MKLRETSGTKNGGEIGMEGMWVYYIKTQYLHVKFLNQNEMNIESLFTNDGVPKTHYNLQKLKFNCLIQKEKLLVWKLCTPSPIL